MYRYRLRWSALHKRRVKDRSGSNPPLLLFGGTFPPPGSIGAPPSARTPPPGQGMYNGRFKLPRSDEEAVRMRNFERLALTYQLFINEKDGGMERGKCQAVTSNMIPIRIQRLIKNMTRKMWEISLMSASVTILTVYNWQGWRKKRRETNLSGNRFDTNIGTLVISYMVRNYATSC